MDGDTDTTENLQLQEGETLTMSDEKDTTVAGPQPMSLTAEKAFSNCRPMLEIQLELSVNSVASKAYSAGLIGNQLLTSVIRKKHMTQLERTLCLLLDIQSKMLQAEDASAVMEEFIKILEEEAAYRYLVKRIKKECKNTPNSEKAVFTQLQDDLAQVLQGSITSVTAAAFSRGLITPETRDIVVDASADHDKVQIVKVLAEIHKRIIGDPGKLRVFIDKVMKEIGAPVQHLIDKLEKDLEEAPAKQLTDKQEEGPEEAPDTT